MTVRLEPDSCGGFPSRSLAEPVNPGARGSGPIEGASIVRSVEVDDHGVLVVRCERLDARDVSLLRCRFVDGATSTEVPAMESYDVWDGEAFSTTVVQFRVPSGLATSEVVVVVLYLGQALFESVATRFALVSADYELFLDTPVAHGRAGVYGSGPPIRTLTQRRSPSPPHSRVRCSTSDVGPEPSSGPWRPAARRSSVSRSTGPASER